MLDCKVLSEKGVNSYQQLKSLTLPAISGEMQLLPGQSEIFVILKEGKIRLDRADGKSEKIDIIGGECHVVNNKAIVIL